MRIFPSADQAGNAASHSCAEAAFVHKEKRFAGIESADVFHRDLTLQLGVRIMDMQRLMVELTPDLELGGFTARVPDIPAYGEGSTEDEAMADLMQALTAYIEAFGLDDAVGRLNPPSSLRQIDLQLDDLVRA